MIKSECRKKKIFQIDKKEICITSSQIKQAIDLLVNENEILQDEVYKLEEELQQKENIIKEVREILNQDKASASFNTAERIALEILDKDGDKNEPNK